MNYFSYGEAKQVFGREGEKLVGKKFGQLIVNARKKADDSRTPTKLQLF